MLLTVVLMTLAILSQESLVNGDAIFDITKYGAKGDGRTDDSEAFRKVWELVCHGSKEPRPVALIPGSGKFILHPSLFKGPCNADSVKVQLDGQIIAPGNYLQEGTQWITFRDVNNLEVGGKGSIEGGGQRALGYRRMEHKEEEGRDNGEEKPTNVAFFACNHLNIWGISSRFSAKNHVSISQCQNVVISNVHLTAPGDSKNTDGIDISRSTWITIKDSDIRTGDDCIAIGAATSNVNISNVQCGPGHGISIGSFKAGESNVEKVHVQHCTFSGTQNGARIKTFPYGTDGYVRSVTFSDIILNNVRRPIVIDQEYDDRLKAAGNGLQPQNGGVSISDVTFSGFEGTCSGEEAIYLKCLNGPGCTGITLNNVHIKGHTGQSVVAVCSNVHGKQYSTWPKVSCLAG